MGGGGNSQNAGVLVDLVAIVVRFHTWNILSWKSNNFQTWYSKSNDKQLFDHPITLALISLRLWTHCPCLHHPYVNSIMQTLRFSQVMTKLPSFKLVDLLSHIQPIFTWLTLSGLQPPYSNINLGLHWLTQCLFFPSQQQSTIWTYVMQCWGFINSISVSCSIWSRCTHC